MLVLTRKANQAILIGDTVKVQVLEVRGDYVKLGVTAPREVKVFRQEVLEAIKESTLDAARVEKSQVEKIVELFRAKKPQ